ncbi:MAG: alpha/beta hydrolase family protein, partial [Actinomycetota bacterium]
SGSEPRLLADVEVHDFGEAPLVPFGRSGVLGVASVRGAGVLFEIEPDVGPRVLLGGHLVVTGAAEAGGTVVVAYTDPTTPGEVGAVVDGEVRALTDFAAPLRRATVTAPQREFTATASDGYPVHGWVYLPEGDGPHPVLLNIHGGPYAQYGWGWFDEAQVYAAAGYAVVQCNPRGSAGYGREHGLAIRHAMGTADRTDVLAFLDGAVAEFGLDGARVGILGGSYGGYLTAWTIAHDHRFAAAIVERGYLDPVNFVGTSDIGWFFSDAYTGSDPERIAAQSPMAHVGAVRTPTLVLHSEQDLRCPLEQAQRYFAALLRGGVEAEMLVFPGENHELSRSGSPWHRKQRFDAILEWWGRHLPVG